MAPDGDFSVEELLQAIAAQLDRTQDAMRLKAVNRPLTYAIRDFSLDLKVFVAMGEDGNVRLRSAGPGDVGASTIQIGFTTMTAPMIEEATIPLTMTMAPQLEELGLSAPERRSLERLGVRNAAQLSRLGQYTGTNTVSRWANIPVERLRAALQLGRPRVSGVEPTHNGSPAETPVVEPPVAVQPPLPADEPAPVGDGGDRTPPFRRPIGHGRFEDRPELIEAAPLDPERTIVVSPGTSRLRVEGRNLLSEGAPPLVKLNDRELPLVDAFDDHVLVDLPEGPTEGQLSVEFADGVQTYALSVGGTPSDSPVATFDDPWEPAR